jgi:hypothetical protein
VVWNLKSVSSSSVVINLIINSSLYFFSSLQVELLSSMIKATGNMNENLHHSQLSDTSSHNGGGSGYGNLELEKMNPLGELNFFFGERSASNSQQQRPQQQQQQQQNNQQQPGKRSMDDVLKKLSSKMHISHSPDEEMDPFTIKDRSVSEFYLPRPTHVSFPILYVPPPSIGSLQIH